MITVQRKDVYKIIGLMSGTSHDGVDAAVVEISRKNSNCQSNAAASIADCLDNISVNLIAHYHKPYPQEIKEQIRLAFSGNTELICRLNFTLGEFYADVVNSALERTSLSSEDIDAVASHGQTIYHIPPQTDKALGSTLQIGESAVIAQRTGILTISDFRTMDMAVRGQGAPLAPLADYILFRKSGMTRAVLNIGGMANVTIVKERIEDTLAFDTGPGNVLIDEAVRVFTNNSSHFDRDGKIAASGSVNHNLLNDLIEHPYYKKRPPKSTGRELFGPLFVKDTIDGYNSVSMQDIICTFTHLTAKTVYDAIAPFNADEIIVTGGGVWNVFLFNLLKDMFSKKQINVNAITKYNIAPESKEALSFAILGYRTLNGLYGNVPSATGAKKTVVLGKLTMPGG
ncbi:Anhydro-N-acetylmuramic acid kinase [Candidatus Magnetoovum chiemensis]|nr:Anhydro-N-acetylmuramic acid kinase [Candidatus Magnetoovum chiemensis]